MLRVEGAAAFSPAPVSPTVSSRPQSAAADGVERSAVAFKLILRHLPQSVPEGPKDNSPGRSPGKAHQKAFAPHRGAVSHPSRSAAVRSSFMPRAYRNTASITTALFGRGRNYRPAGRARGFAPVSCTHQRPVIQNAVHLGGRSEGSAFALRVRSRSPTTQPGEEAEMIPQ